MIGLVALPRGISTWSVQRWDTAKKSWTKEPNRRRFESGSLWKLLGCESYGTRYYTFELRRWPTEANKPLASSLPAGAAVPGASKAFRETPGEAIPVVSAGLRINGDVKATASVAKDSQSVQMSVSLQPGSYELAPFFRQKMAKRLEPITVS